MKKTFFYILIFLPLTIYSQMFEVGLIAGASNYIGDIGNEYYIYPKKIAGGFLFKYNINTRIALRTNYMHFELNADDKDALSTYRNQRNVNFNNTLTEIGIGTEFSCWEYSIKSRYTPYLITQIAIFSHKAARELKDNEVMYKSQIDVALPIGVGFKGRLTKNLAYAIEGLIRYTFTDTIDFTDKDIKPFNFGKQGNDHYIFSGVSLVYTFGREACYTDQFENKKLRR